MDVHALRVGIIDDSATEGCIWSFPNFREVIVESGPKFSGDHIVVRCKEKVVRSIWKIKCLSCGKVSYWDTSHFLDTADELCIFVGLRVLLVDSEIRVPPVAVKVHHNLHCRHKLSGIGQLEQIFGSKWRIIIKLCRLFSLNFWILDRFNWFD